MKKDIVKEKMDGKVKSALFLVGFTIVLNLLSIFITLRSPNDTTSINVVLSSVSTLINIIMWILIVRKFHTLVVVLGILTQFIQNGIIINLTIAGYGYLWYLIVLVIGSAYSVFLLPKKTIRWGIMASIFIGFMSIMIDYFGSDSRPIARPEDISIQMNFAEIYVIFTAVMVVRQWRSLDISTKLLLSFIVAAGTVMVSVQFTMAFVQLRDINTLIAAGTDPQLARQYVFNNGNLINIITGQCLFVAILYSLVIAQGITTPLVTLAGNLQNLAMGDLNRDVSQKEIEKIISRSDEIGTAGMGIVETETYLQKMADVARKISDGDLTCVIIPKSEKDELGLAFTQMTNNLRIQVEQVTESANHVDSASNQLASAANQTGHATNQINSTMQQVVEGTSQQTESIGKTASSAEQMSRAIEGVARGVQEQSTAVLKASDITTQITTAIQQVALNAQTSAKEASHAAETARNGAKTVQETIQGMQTIKAKVGLSAEKVQEMGERSNQIGAIVETIDDIASQTNLLALNAAIEAARAGEHGKGFAVVADEVRKLAERSSIATKEIGALIKGIQQTVAEAVLAMNEGAKEVEQGVTRASLSDEALTSILKAAETVNQQVDDIAQAAQQISVSSNELVVSMDSVSAVVEENTAATEQMSVSSNEVTEAVQLIASVSEENGAALEQVSAATEEMNAQVEEVSASAQSLAEMAKQLQNVVAQFKL